MGQLFAIRLKVPYDRYSRLEGALESMRSLILIAPFVACAALIYQPATAEAGIDACGDIYMDAEADCEVVAPGAECETKCTPISVEVACAADLQVECSAECSGSATVECTGSCDASCQVDCDVDATAFDCSAYCTADCSGGCEAECSDSQCLASCEANCSATCDVDCEGLGVDATCTDKCESSCSGSCTAESTLECQTECSSSGFVDCTTDVQGGCETDCEATEGALFCDGQYVDVEGDLDACIGALRDLLDIEVDGYANAECDGNTCTAEAGASCSVSGGTGGALGSMAPFAFALAFFFSGRRRRRKKL
ncbi:MAG: hypothetical protein GY811_20775 [Myxococcales bacterium]|nr:hypothetical protein [Myxococcales bacterium]